ncbi:unnamed protein product [Owenia fusiformis]|nr:unnamed protein product [Owenia fusiformis]
MADFSSSVSGGRMEGVQLRSESEDITSADVTTDARRNLQSDDDEEDDFQTYMSVVWQGGKVGIAYYDIDTTCFYMMMDTVETMDFHIISKVFEQVKPMCIVTTAKQDEGLLAKLKSLGGKGPEIDDFVQLLPTLDFSLEVSKRRILSMNLPSIPNHFTESERTLHMSSLVPFDNICMVRAVGGLLKFLDKKRVGIELESTETRVPILAMRTFSLECLMIVDDASYSALQIFQQRNHPSGYKSGASSGKEGLSLFRIMNRCKSIIGSKMLRQWFMQPLKDMAKLEQRQDAVAFFANPRNIEVTSTLEDCLKHVKHIPRILARMTSSQATIAQWQALYKTAYNATYIGDVCRQQKVRLEVFRKIGEKFTEDLHRIADLIHRIVDVEESTIQNKFVVKQNVDPDLDEKKRTYNGLPDFMTKVAQSELNQLGEEITECNVIYLPQLGYLLAIPLCDSIREEDNYNIPNLEFVFMSSNMVHYKSESTKELDLLLGDVQCEIADQETVIMHRLQNTILEHSQVLLDVMDCAAELDCLITLANCAREYNYTRPQLTQDNIIHVTAGRHPLQELCCSPFVPNETYSDEHVGRMKVLTGPNASGKSIYLKQVALIVFMAQIGSFIPAESAVVGLMDRLFTRIRTLETVSAGLSTFMMDLSQVSSAVNNATERSLVILDEFGKGTESSDGIALLCATLKQWLSSGTRCPHVFVSTHFHALVTKSMLPKSTHLKFQTMEVIEDGNTLVFLYQLIDGSTSHSYASHIAEASGLPSAIIKRGKQVCECLGENKLVNRVGTSKSESAFIKYKAIVDSFLKVDLDKDDLVEYLESLKQHIDKN